MTLQQKIKQNMPGISLVDIELAILYGLQQTLADKVNPSPLEVEYFQKCIADQHRCINRIQQQGQ
ncbi:MAG: hypothetical protein CBD88_07365 [Flavobacteriales bacterium TMED228]|nr:MAG: hypothetical protein CBD88_07365 [Flavobacteriales bacterium TMED228]